MPKVDLSKINIINLSEDYLRGVPASQLCVKYGCGIKLLKNLLKFYNIPKRDKIVKKKKWDNLQISLIASSKNYTFVNKEESVKGSSKFYINLICPNGNTYKVLFGDFKQGKSWCQCSICYRKVYGDNKKLSDYEARQCLLNKYNLILTEKYKSHDKFVNCLTREGYLVSVRFQDSFVNFNSENKKYSIFGKNKNTEYNLKVFCEQNRPEYSYIKGQKIESCKSVVIFKYTGENLPSNECRYFKATIDSFVSSDYLISHPFFKKKSKGERKIEDVLKKNNIFYKTNFWFKDCKDKHPLKFDFAIFNKDNIPILIEFDGIQHFKNVEFFTRIYSFDTRVKCDNIKNKYCEDNNIKLYRIPYFDLENVEKIIKDILKIEKIKN